MLCVCVNINKRSFEQEIILLCAHMLHQFKTPRQPPLKNDYDLFCIYSHVIKQVLKIWWNVVIYQADEKN